MKINAKTCMLSAVALACSGPLMAGTLAVTSQTHSIEGISGLTTLQTSNSISYTLGAAYTSGDRVVFTFNEDVVSNTTFPDQITVDPVDSADSDSAVAGMVLGLLSSTGSEASYRVTSVSQPDDTPGDGGTEYSDKTTLGAVITLGSVSYNVSSLDSADLTMSVASTTNSDGTLDTPDTATLATKKTQFGSAAVSTQLDAVIDVAAVKKAFVTDATDTVSWTITNPDTSGWSNLATINNTDGTVITVKGESGSLAGLDSSQFTVAGGGTATYTEASDQVAISYSGDVTSDTLTFTPPTGDNAVTLSKQSFTLDAVYNYTTVAGATASTTISSGLAAGAWTLNGASVVIPYMPYSDSASQILYVTNTGTQSGDIRVTAYDTSGNNYDLGVVATSTAGQLVKLATKVKTALETQGFTKGKLTLTVTVDVPSKDVIVYASYNIGGSDRGFVQTDQMINSN